MNTTNFKLTQAQKRKINALQKAYLKAKALNDTITEMETAIQQKILDDGNYIICDKYNEYSEWKNRRITRPCDTYLMDEDIFINDFLVKCYAEFQNQGIANPNGKEWCCNAESQETLKQAENQLVNIAIEILPFPELKKTFEQFKTHWKYRLQILDLILKLDCGKIEL